MSTEPNHAMNRTPRQHPGSMLEILGSEPVMASVRHWRESFIHRDDHGHGGSPPGLLTKGSH
jgi:hypothetical protein